jgi:hypothetical protein
MRSPKIRGRRIAGGVILGEVDKSVTHRVQVDFPNVLTTEIGLPCQRISQFMRSCCIPGIGAAAPLGQMPVKCLA